MSIYIPASSPLTGMSNTSIPHRASDDSNIDPALLTTDPGNRQCNPAEAAAALNQAGQRKQQQALYSVSVDDGKEENSGAQPIGHDASNFFEDAVNLDDFLNNDWFKEFENSGSQISQATPAPQQTPGQSTSQAGAPKQNVNANAGFDTLCPVPSFNGRGTTQRQNPATQFVGQQQMNHISILPQSRPHHPQPNLSSIGSGNRGVLSINLADRALNTPHLDSNLQHKPQYELPGPEGQDAWNYPTADMDNFRNVDFDYQDFMAGNMFDQHPDQHLQGPATSQYLANEAPRLQQDVAGPSHIDPSLLDTCVEQFRPPTHDSPTPTPSFHYSPREPSQRPKGKSRDRATPAASVSENPECIDCGKRYRTTSSPGRCNRCGAKYERRIAEPHTYTLDPKVPNLAAARGLIYPPIQGRFVQDDDFDQLRVVQRENQYLQQLLNSVNVVQAEDNGADEWKARQQKTLNEKAKLEPGYTNEQVTARLRALFWEAVMFHAGGPESVYAVGGDNSGYSENLKLTFSERFKIICDVLRANKRVVMDVVEGRGVQGFVSNPKKYDDRKASNNFCNVKKKMIMDKGKEIEGGDESISAGPSRGAKRKRMTRQDSPEDALWTVDIPQAGSASGLRRSPRHRQDVSSPPGSPMVEDDVSLYSPDSAEYHPLPEQSYGSGRSVTANWIHGNRRGR